MELDSIPSELAQDPYLAFQPAFAYTLLTQLLLNGITFTLLVVLLIHLLFTTQYHYPLAPLNYCLQLSSIVVVLISVIVKIVIILRHSSNKADIWPYDLNYIEVPIPPDQWTTAENAAWFLLQAFNIGLANITHIQFLTLLFPSRTEVRLIIFVLGPLAVAASGLVFTALSPSQTVIDVGDAIRNVFNSTLLLIFTSALGIWGFLVNRRRAWRMDGGTAVFGSGALALAIVSTIGNFIAIVEDGIDWLQHLLYAAILWQTWLGWWWWVGSGMGIGEVEDIMERAERRKRKAVKKQRKQKGLSAKLAQSKTPSLAGLAEYGSASANAMAGFTSGVAGILRTGSDSLIRRRTLRNIEGRVDIEEGTHAEDNIEMDTIHGNTDTPSSSQPANQRVEFENSTSQQNGAANGPSLDSETSSTSQTPSLHQPHSIGQFLSFPTHWVQLYLYRLRRAHEDAAKKQAMQRAELRRKVFSTGDGAGRNVEVSGKMESPVEHQPRSRGSLSADPDGVGWGLGSFGIREHQESARRLQQAGERLQENRLLNVEEELGSAPASPSSRSPGVVQEERRSGTDGEQQSHVDGRTGLPPEVTATDDDWEDVEPNAEEGESSDLERRRAQAARKTPDPRSVSGWSWWGPLKDWRLNDRSAF